jgi:mono/diheme cytochrome c family protein
MVLKQFIYTFLLPFTFISCNSNPIENKDSKNVKSEKGKSLFVLHCESCHGFDGKKKMANAADLSISKISSIQIKNTILNGNDKGMMPYKEIITSKSDLDSLLEYVKTLRK